MVVVVPAKDKGSKELVPDWQKADLDAMKSAIAEVDWVTELEGKSGVEAWDYLKEKIELETDRLCT